eukprot:scaffold107071_cov51-Phaeocystis_antarctica.AAC.1
MGAGLRDWTCGRSRGSPRALQGSTFARFGAFNGVNQWHFGWCSRYPDKGFTTRPTSYRYPQLGFQQRVPYPVRPLVSHTEDQGWGTWQLDKLTLSAHEAEGPGLRAFRPKHLASGSLPYGVDVVTGGVFKDRI